MVGTFRYEAPTMADPSDESVQIPDLSKQKDIIFASDLATSKGESGRAHYNVVVS